MLMFHGPPKRVHRIARRTGAQFVSAEQLRQWLVGGPPHPALNESPTAVLLAPPGTIILPRHLPSSNVGNHSWISPQELLIPLLVAQIANFEGRQDSAGPERWREGNGIIRESEMTTATEMSLWFECSGNPLDRDSKAELADSPPAESFNYATVDQLREGIRRLRRIVRESTNHLVNYMRSKA